MFIYHLSKVIQINITILSIYSSLNAYKVLHKNIYIYIDYLLKNVVFFRSQSCDDINNYDASPAAVLNYRVVGQ